MAPVWARLVASHAARDPEVVLTLGEIADLLEHVPRTLAVDPDYGSRTGFDETFLGVAVPVPTLGADVADDAALPEGAEDDPVLRYHHFSVVLSASRGLARWTAANLDGQRRFLVDRTSDRWVLDPRLPDGVQVGEALYAHNDLDRGHLVRRQDPVWGDTYDEAVAANDDTFHFTNCSPQHSAFNQSPDTWLGLEDYVLTTVADQRLRAVVLTGPVLGDRDPVYRDVEIPLEFWKVVATVDDAGELHATAYVLSQAELVDDLDDPVGSERIEVEIDDLGPVFGPYKTFQVPVADVEAVTSLDLGPLRDADPLGDELETGAVGRPRLRRHELRTLADVRLRRGGAG